MAIGFRDILKVADDLLAQGGEPSERSSVSRFYYAAFHGAEYWLSTTPGMPSAGAAGGGTHDVVYHKLQHLDRTASGAQKTKGRSLAARFLTLKARRVVADYKLHMTPLAAEAAQSQAEAHIFITDCTTPP